MSDTEYWGGELYPADLWGRAPVRGKAVRAVQEFLESERCVDPTYSLGLVATGVVEALIAAGVLSDEVGGDFSEPPKCPCGQHIVRKGGTYCSQYCSGKYGGGRAPKATHCARCGRAKDEANTCPDGSCRNCRNARDRARHAAQKPKPRAKRSKPVVDLSISAPVKDKPVESAGRRWLNAPGWPAPEPAGRT